MRRSQAASWRSCFASALLPGQVNVQCHASTFKVYNAGEAIGDAMPTLPLEPLPPPPPLGNGPCGGFGVVIAMIVLVVVTIYTAGAASELMGAELAGGASGGIGSMGAATMSGGVTGGALGSATGAVAAGIGGAVGAAASQGVLIATGNQHGFQWGGVALGAIGAAAGAEAGVGMARYGSTLSGGGAFLRGAAQAALSSTISQGVGVATGLQQHFDWRGIAASAIAGGVANEVGQSSIGKVPGLGKVVGGFASQTASALVSGGSMQDRLPGMIGAVAGDTIGGEIGQRLQSTSTSTLYGVGSDVDELVAQSAYATDAGKQFAWSANAQIDGAFGAPIAGSPYSSDAQGYAVPYPAIAVSALPEEMGSAAPQTGAAGGGVEAGTGYSFYPAGSDGIVHMPAIAVRPSPSGENPLENAGLVDEGVQRVAGTVKGVAQVVGGALQFLNDQGWVVGNALTGGWLAHHNSYASDAVMRETALGQSLAGAPGYLMSLVSGAGDVTPSSAFNDVFHVDEIQRLNAAHDFVNAQALLTQGAMGAASLAVGGAGTVSDVLESGGLAARTFGQSGTGQYLAARMDDLQANPFFATQSFVAPPNMNVWTSVDGVAGAGTESIAPESVGQYGRFASADEFAGEALTRYQRYTDEAYAATQDAYTKGRLAIPDGMSADTIIGQRTDAIARIRMSRWLDSEGIAEGSGEAIQLNRWLRDPSGSGLYRIPDVRIPDANLILDGTIGHKWQATPQVADFYKFSGGSNVTIVRPTQLGGSYSLVPGHDWSEYGMD